MELMLATARWMTASARARRETRGLLRRTDQPVKAEGGVRRVLSGGLGKPFAHMSDEPGKAAAQ